MSSNRILVIAGSDSSGGAGLEADQKVIAAHGCYAMTATTALTAQNTQGVYDIHQTPSAFVRKQIDACIEDIGVDVVKTGMLASASTIEVVADALKKHNVPISVVDPVMVSTSGAQLLPEDAVDTLITQLLPLTTLLTPNLPEAQLILKRAGKAVGEPKSMDDIVSMAKAVQALGPKGRFLEYILDREDVKGPWREHTHHSFVKQLADGSLPLGKFRNYLIQDYLFLIQFSRANALAAYKAKNLDDINKSARIVQHIQEEMSLHIKYCEGFGLTKAQIESHKEHPACTAYTRYVLDIGQSEDWFGLQIALMPCLIGYGYIARRLYDDPKTKRDGNAYWNWVEQYVAEDYTDAVRAGLEIIEKHAVLQSPSRIEQLVEIFIHATKMETGFWDMGSGSL
ncbi:hypothetical protein GTA08_BOTSDO05853 [Neofusicoccum parvum]|nr:hypothetical protein GTA08_BOTSDO05853 [Neofusicoccum parvum]